MLKEVLGRVDTRHAEVATLKREVERLRKERDELVGQLQFAIDQSNRETRAAAHMRSELLSRSTVPSERLDFCAGEHGETTAVLPSPHLVSRRRRVVRDDDTVRVRREDSRAGGAS
jgi:hypothetical protein